MRHALRHSLITLALLLSGISNAQTKFGEPQPIAPELRMSSLADALHVAAAPLGDGYLTAWMEHSGIRVVRLNAAGEVISDPLVLGSVITSPVARAQKTKLIVASDGVDALVGWSVADQYDSSFRIAHLEGGKRNTLIQRGFGSLDGLIFNGDRYIAIIGGARNRAEVVELDRKGYMRAPAPLAISKQSSDYTTWQEGLFNDGGVTSLVTVIDGRLTRIKLTDATGTLQPSVFEDLSFQLPFEHDFKGAGHIGGRWYVVYGKGDRNYVQFLDSQAPIVVDGFTTLAAEAMRVSGGELYLFGTVAGADGTIVRGARVSPDGAVRFFDVANESPRAIGAAVMTRGVLLLTGTNTPVARVIRTLWSGGRTFVRPPVRLHSIPASQLGVVIAAHGDGFLTAWYHPSSVGEIWSRQLDRTGAAAGPPQLLGQGMRPQIASNGNVALVVWARTPKTVLARRIDRDGNPLGDAVPLDRDDAASQTHVIGAGWDGLQFSAAWATPTYVMALPVTEDGQVRTEPVRILEMPKGPFVSMSFAVSPSGALLVYAESYNANGPTAVRLTHDMHPAGGPFKVADIPASLSRVIWLGDHYLVTFNQDASLRAARVSASGEPLDAPYGIWLERGFSFHNTAFGNGRLIVTTPLGGFTTDRNLRRIAAFEQFTLPFEHAVAIREDGAALVAYIAPRIGSTAERAEVRTIP